MSKVHLQHLRGFDRALNTVNLQVGTIRYLLRQQTAGHDERKHNRFNFSRCAVEDPTPFGWLTTADHKRTGRLFIISSLGFLIIGVVLDLLVRLDLTSASKFVGLDADSFAQSFALSRETLVLLS